MTTPRMTAFNPGASPPPVDRAIRRIFDLDRFFIVNSPLVVVVSAGVVSRLALE